MTKKILVILTFALAFLLPLSAGEETRTIRFMQDDAQLKTTTKMYYLKNLKATDIMTFVDSIVRRYWANSQVRALNMAAAKQQVLIVTTGDGLIPYLDQIIALLDHPGKKDEFGSVVTGIGYKWKVYYPRYREINDLTRYAHVMLSGNGSVYAENRALWLRDDLDDIDYALDWIKYFDRPVPQASITFRYYSVRESTLRDVGIDYLAWKNGPGMNLFDFAFSAGRLNWDKVFNTAMNLAGNGAFNWAYGGIFTAPAFDMSFIRLLQQAGDAKIVATASVNVINNQDIATISLTPTYNGITKDPSNHSAAVQPFELTDMMLNVYNPSICFFTDAKEVSDMGWIPTSKEFYAKNKGSLVFAYDLTSSDPVEANNYGTQIGSSAYTSSSWKTVEFGKEQLLVNAVREFDVEQTIGVPFLCQLPVLKYIFGTTTTMKEKNYIFVTVEANLVHPEGSAKPNANAVQETVTKK